MFCGMVTTTKWPLHVTHSIFNAFHLFKQKKNTKRMENLLKLKE